MQRSADVVLQGLAAAVVMAIGAGGCVAPAPTGGVAAPVPGEVRFELAGPGGAALVVPVRINDAGPFPFVLDTGATLTCVEDGLASELDLPRAEASIAIGGGLRGLGPMRLVTLDSVQLGEAVMADLHGCVVDLAPIRQAGLDVRGLLGLNFLRAYRLIVDFGTHGVRLEPLAGSTHRE